MGVAEIAARLGVKPRRVHQIANNPHGEFPEPEHLTCGLVWYTPDVEEWIRIHRPHLAAPGATPTDTIDVTDLVGIADDVISSGVDLTARPPTAEEKARIQALMDQINRDAAERHRQGPA